MANHLNDRNVTGLEDDLSPFELARKLQITINYYDFPKTIYGLYSPEDSSAQVLINENISLEKQEKVCEQINAHHTSYNCQAPALCIDEDTYVKLEKGEGFLSRLVRRKNVIVPE